MEGGKAWGESSGWEVQRFAEVGKAWEKILSSSGEEEIQREEEEKYFGRGIRNHPRMTSPHKWLLCDQMISGTLFFRSGLFNNILYFFIIFEIIIFSLGLEAVTEAICHTGHLLDKVVYFRHVIGNLSCIDLPLL